MTLKTDSGKMTERARRYLNENPQALDLFAVMPPKGKFNLKAKTKIKII